MPQVGPRGVSEGHAVAVEEGSRLADALEVGRDGAVGSVGCPEVALEGVEQRLGGGTL
jgi:hypothetical protein